MTEPPSRQCQWSIHFLSTAQPPCFCSVGKVPKGNLTDGLFPTVAKKEGERERSLPNQFVVSPGGAVWLQRGFYLRKSSSWIKILSFPVFVFPGITWILSFSDFKFPQINSHLIKLKSVRKVVLGIFQAALGELNSSITIKASLKSFGFPHSWVSFIKISLRWRIWAWQPCKQSLRLPCTQCALEWSTKKSFWPLDHQASKWPIHTLEIWTSRFVRAIFFFRRLRYQPNLVTLKFMVCWIKWEKWIG